MLFLEFLSRSGSHFKAPIRLFIIDFSLFFSITVFKYFEKTDQFFPGHVGKDYRLVHDSTNQQFWFQNLEMQRKPWRPFTRRISNLFKVCLLDYKDNLSFYMILLNLMVSDQAAANRDIETLKEENRLQSQGK